MREFGDQRADFLDVGGCFNRKEIGVGEVSIVVSIFLGSHFLGFAEVLVPPPGGLDKRFPIVECFALTGNLVMNGTAHGGGGVHILELDLGAKGVAFIFANRDVYITTHLALVHVGIRDASSDENLLERL